MIELVQEGKMKKKSNYIFDIMKSKSSEYFLHILNPRNERKCINPMSNVHNSQFKKVYMYLALQILWLRDSAMASSQIHN